MKLVQIVITLILINLGSLTSVHAQCNQLLQFQKGRSFEYVILDRKGRKISSTTSTVEDVYQENGLTVSKMTTSKNGEPLYWKCDGKFFYPDLSSVFGMMNENPDMSFTIKTDYANELKAPINLSLQESLKDVSVELLYNVKGMEGSSKMMYENFKVIGKEKVTVPAGTYDCLVIEGWATQQIEMMGMNITKKFKIVRYYNSDIGQVKVETFTESGELAFTQLLNKFS